MNENGRLSRDDAMKMFDMYGEDCLEYLWDDIRSFEDDILEEARAQINDGAYPDDDDAESELVMNAAAALVAKVVSL